MIKKKIKNGLKMGQGSEFFKAFDSKDIKKYPKTCKAFVHLCCYILSYILPHLHIIHIILIACLASMTRYYIFLSFV